MKAARKLAGSNTYQTKVKLAGQRLFNQFCFGRRDDEVRNKWEDLKKNNLMTSWYWKEWP
jgi:hypothetical protein